MTGTDYINRHFLYPGTIFFSRTPYAVDTILGSCISVCLWDPVSKCGSINHFMLPVLNKEGETPFKYGNMAIPELVTRMIAMGSNKKDLRAKIFGGSEFKHTKGAFSIGRRNQGIARKMLREEQIPIISFNVGGDLGRKMIFHTDTGEVLIKFIRIKIPLLD